MEPNVFVGGEQPGQLWTDETDDVPQHGDEDEEAIDGEDETSTTGDPDGEPERVQALEKGVDILAGVGQTHVVERSIGHACSPDYTIHRRR